jgi:hypothetical protein
VIRNAVAEARLLSGNRWHLKDKSRLNMTLCGRRLVEEGFSWRTAQKFTDDVKQFRENPCIGCLKRYKGRT